jgi:hypothetical protein
MVGAPVGALDRRGHTAAFLGISSVFFYSALVSKTDIQSSVFWLCKPKLQQAVKFSRCTLLFGAFLRIHYLHPFDS